MSWLAWPGVLVSFLGVKAGLLTFDLFDTIRAQGWAFWGEGV
jgi:hypothetical protein